MFKNIWLKDWLTVYFLLSFETADLRASGVDEHINCIEECPKSLETVARSTPASTSRVAKVCLSHEI